jgi:hypothetical protein
MSIAIDETAKLALRQDYDCGDPDSIRRLGVDGQGLLTEIYKLSQQGLLSNASNSVWISVAYVNPSAMRLQGSGFVLASVSDTVPSHARDRV